MNSCFRRPLLFLALLIAPALVSASPLKVYSSSSVETFAGKLAAQGQFEFADVPAGTFQKPAVTKWAKLDVPSSIKKEAKEHNVQVGVVLSAEGKVLATCIVSSDCVALEAAAEKQVRKLQFSPAKIDDVAVPFFVVYPVSYRYQP